jgi:hypothetical protein
MIFDLNLRNKMSPSTLCQAQKNVTQHGNFVRFNSVNNESAT